MFDSIKKYKNIGIAILVVVALFIGYSILFGGEKNNSVLVSSQVNPALQASGNNDLLLLLINLRAITLDNRIFADPAFNRLVDFGQELVPEPKGRQNPFAPVGTGI